MEASDKQKSYFTRQLMAWHTSGNDRSLPWKNEKDPYRIWLSEVILQQTRAQQGLPYYLRFTEAYPTVSHLAAAPEEEAFRLWQGLGYYNRCRNMLATARYISEYLGGKFPGSYDGLLALKGIGPYTAAAIASFAFGLPNAVVDGNVYRVLSRYFGIDTPFDTTAGKNLFSALAASLLFTKDSSAYNQAIMDLGATVCTPGKPRCDECPLHRLCVARIQDITGLLPVKSKKTTVKKRWFNYLLIIWNDEIWLHKRTGKDIWANLHEPLLIETAKPANLATLLASDVLKEAGLSKELFTDAGKFTQRLTHQLIDTKFYIVKPPTKPGIAAPDGFWHPISQLHKIAFPKTLVSFLENNLYF